LTFKGGQDNIKKSLKHEHRIEQNFTIKKIIEEKVLEKFIEDIY